MAEIYEEFYQLLCQFTPLSIIEFCLATISFPGFPDDAYANIEMIITNASSIPLLKEAKDCNENDFEVIYVLSEKMKQTSIFDNIFDPDNPFNEIQVGFFLNRAAVRLKAYPAQMLNAAYDRFKPHDDWFKTNLGFEINDCLLLAKYMENKIHSLFDAILKIENIDNFVYAKYDAPPYIIIPKKDYIDIIKNYFMFEFNDIKEITNNAAVSTKLLERLSCNVSEYEKCRSFLDFNFLYKKPILKHEGQYIIPLFPSLCQSFSETFYYDIIETDPDYLSTYETIKGSLSENRCIRMLKYAFLDDFIFPNVKYRDKEGEHEIADVLVLFDDTIVIVQNKSKLLTEAASKGDLKAISSDLEKSIIAAYEQCVSSKKQILDKKITSLTNSKWTDIPINLDKITNYYFVISLEDRFPIILQKSLESMIDFNVNGFPFIVNMYDLEIIVGEINTPNEMIDYLSSRIDVNSKSIIGIFDELDLLAYYLQNGRTFDLPPIEEGRAPDEIIFIGQWDEFNRKRQPQLGYKLQQDQYTKFVDFMIDRAYETKSEDGFNIITKISSIPRLARREIGRKSQEKAFLSATDGTPHFFSILPASVDFGLSILFSPENRDDSKRRLEQICEASKYARKYTKWIGISMRPANEPTTYIDYLYIEREWKPDEGLDELAGKLFAPPEKKKEYEYGP